MIRPIALSLAALLVAPAALAGPRLIVDAEPGSVTVVVDHRPDVVIVERERVRTRRVVRSRGYDVRPVYEREVIVYDDYDDCDDRFVPPGHRKHEWHHRHSGAYDRHAHHGHDKRWKKHNKRKHKKHKRNKKRRGGDRWARY